MYNDEPIAAASMIKITKKVANFPLELRRSDLAVIVLMICTTKGIEIIEIIEIRIAYFDLVKKVRVQLVMSVMVNNHW